MFLFVCFCSFSFDAFFQPQYVVTLQWFFTHNSWKENKWQLSIDWGCILSLEKNHRFLYFLAPILHMPPILTGDMLIIKNDTQRWQNVSESFAVNLHSFLFPLQRLREISPASCLNTVNEYLWKKTQETLVAPIMQVHIGVSFVEVLLYWYCTFLWQ